MGGPDRIITAPDTRIQDVSQKIDIFQNGQPFKSSAAFTDHHGQEGPDPVIKFLFGLRGLLLTAVPPVFFHIIIGVHQVNELTHEKAHSAQGPFPLIFLIGK